ncbi:Late embryogenesis abundant protein [Macleaya cordata]|uniref:Late embryogenesis abundant protein n=1 Tax=Macleaya cordata TaxID=56857 RepID=A0A200QQG3_MACCD|nr:Late embryogenesis abundant protein [Macleaya cordata]
MARSFSNTKLAVSALFDGVSLAINRSRSYSGVASQAVGSSVVRGGRSGIVKAAVGEERVMMKEEVSPWVPDPVTGYYRPENRADEIDVAELREMLLKK